MQNVSPKRLVKMEVVYGLTILVAAALLAMPHLFGLFRQEPGQRAGILAEELALALEDYRRETGAWPAAGPAGLDLTVLADPAAAEATAGGNPLAGSIGPLVNDMPLDPWGRPFRALLIGGGRGLAVFSPGPDGRLDTAPGRLWDRRHLPDAFDGDDVGFLLALAGEGGPE